MLLNKKQKNDKQSDICNNNNILLTSRMTQTKLNFVLAKPIEQNKNNNNSDGTPLLRKRKQHKKGERGKIFLIKFHLKYAF